MGFYFRPSWGTKFILINLFIYFTFFGFLFGEMNRCNINIVVGNTNYKYLYFAGKLYI
jgi:hypothetical protein